MPFPFGSPDPPCLPEEVEQDESNAPQRVLERLDTFAREIQELLRHGKYVMAFESSLALRAEIAALRRNLDSGQAGG